MRALVAIGDSGGIQVEFGLGAERFIGWQDERLEPVALGGCIADGMAKKWQLVCQGRPKKQAPRMGSSRPRRRARRWGKLGGLRRVLAKKRAEVDLSIT
jgi:hypothetical protein